MTQPDPFENFRQAVRDALPTSFPNVLGTFERLVELTRKEAVAAERERCLGIALSCERRIRGKEAPADWRHIADLISGKGGK